MLDPRTNLPAPPPVPHELLFPPESTGETLLEAEAPRWVDAPACPVCHAALSWRHHHGDAFRALCARHPATTRMESPRRPAGRYCRWTGWLTQNRATQVWLVVDHGETMPPDAAFETMAAWTPS